MYYSCHGINSQVKCSVSRAVCKWFIYRFGKERHKFTVPGNRNIKKIESKNSVQSSLKSYPL